jgi:methylmalonyl-CoA carboxyltransferase small subunit
LKIQISVDGTAYEVEVDETEDNSLTASASLPPPVRTTIQSTVVPTAKKPTSHSEAGGDVEESKVCRSPVAGIVMRVPVLPGEEVKVDDLIIVLEAMKMETKIGSPVSGKLKSIKVTAGDAVKLNQIMAEFY